MSDILEPLLTTPLDYKDEHVHLDHILQGVLDQEIDELSLRLDLFIALQLGRYKPITIDDLSKVIHDEYEDEQFAALRDSFHLFIQAECMPPAKKLKQGSIKAHNLTIVVITWKFRDLCGEVINEQELKDMASMHRKNWKRYTENYAYRKLMRKG